MEHNGNTSNWDITRFYNNITLFIGGLLIHKMSTFYFPRLFGIGTMFSEQIALTIVFGMSVFSGCVMYRRYKKIDNKFQHIIIKASESWKPHIKEMLSPQSQPRVNYE